MKGPIRITRATSEQRRPRPTPGKLTFGTHFADHMFLMEYTASRGWHDPRIEPYHGLRLEPSALCFHYGQTVFEGLKAYRNEQNEAYLFRWRSNVERLNNSAQRMCMPKVDAGLVGEALHDLVALDRDWIPVDRGSSLYIRPVLIATEPAVGMRTSGSYLFFIITCPVGPYDPKGFSPVNIWVSDSDVRAAPGGTGAAKTGGNYGGSLRAQKEAKAKGFDQVLWLDAREMRYVEEVGTMNIFFLLDGQLITPPLEGTILPGVTRDSVIRIAERWGIPVQERPIDIDEVFEAVDRGRMQEVFGAGTAVVISPVGSLSYRGRQVQIGKGTVGPLATRLYEYLLSLQRGEIEDPFGWVERVDPSGVAV
jgi:branched-chain amino acid aminotransferase